MQDHGIDTIIEHLAQANFIKKCSDNRVYLMPHGISLVEFLRTERGLLKYFLKIDCLYFHGAIHES